MVGRCLFSTVPLRGIIDNAFDDIGWTLFHLVIHVGQIGADNAETEQLDATDEQDEDDQCSESSR